MMLYSSGNDPISACSSFNLIHYIDFIQNLCALFGSDTNRCWYQIRILTSLYNFYISLIQHHFLLSIVPLILYLFLFLNISLFLISFIHLNFFSLFTQFIIFLFIYYQILHLFSNVLLIWNILLQGEKNLINIFNKYLKDKTK